MQQLFRRTVRLTVIIHYVYLCILILLCPSKTMSQFNCLKCLLVLRWTLYILRSVLIILLIIVILSRWPVVSGSSEPYLFLLHCRCDIVSIGVMLFIRTVLIFIVLFLFYCIVDVTCGPWAWCCTSWCAGTRPSRASAAQTAAGTWARPATIVR